MRKYLHFKDSNEEQTPAHVQSGSTMATNRSLVSPSFPFFGTLPFVMNWTKPKFGAPLMTTLHAETIHVRPGGRAVLLHFQVYHPHILQFIETEMKQVVRALPYNAPYRLALSIIPGCPKWSISMETSITMMTLTLSKKEILLFQEENPLFKE